MLFALPVAGRAQSVSTSWPPESWAIAGLRMGAGKVATRPPLWHGPRVPGDYRRLLHAVRPHPHLLGLAVVSMLALADATGTEHWLIGPLFQYVVQAGEPHGYPPLHAPS